MTLTANGKEYIAKNFGVGNCFVAGGVSWTSVDHDGTRLSESGGTKNVVARLINDMVYARIEMITPSTGTFTKSQLISANGAQAITLADCDAIGNEDSGSSQYCVSGVTPPPTPPPTTDTTVGPFEFEFGEICTGDPTAAIDVSGLKMWQETDTFRMNNFNVTNTSDCIAYFATQLKFWPLTTSVPSTCPTAAPEWSGMDRSTWTAGDPYLEIATIAPGETKEIWLDFFVPATTRGRKVLCMYLWANFSKWDLYDELAAIGES